MAKKTLTPRLPKDMRELLSKGFDGDCSGSNKFITDGHSCVLTAECEKPFLEGVPPSEWRSKVKLEAIKKLWDPLESRERVEAFFIGCGKLSQDITVAVMRDARGRFVLLNPYILAFAAYSTLADALAVSPSRTWDKDPIVVLKKGRMVALIMPLRYDIGDLPSGYDTSGPAIPLQGEGH